MENKFHWYLDDLQFGQQAQNRLGESVAHTLDGIRRGYAPIQELYRRIFEGQARVWVEFYDGMVLCDGANAVFAGHVDADSRDPFGARGDSIRLARIHGDG